MNDLLFLHALIYVHRRNSSRIASPHAQVKGGETTRRICIMFMFAAMVIAFLPTSNVYAATYSYDGFWKGKPLTINGVSTNLASDGDTTTYYQGSTINNLFRSGAVNVKAYSINVAYMTEPGTYGSIIQINYTDGSKQEERTLYDTGWALKEIRVLLDTNKTVANIAFLGTGGWKIRMYEIALVDVPDTQAPDQVTGLVATAGDGKVSLSWNANSAPDLAGYRVYKDGSLYTTVTATSANITSLTNDQTYTFTVSAVDTAGNESSKSSPATAKPTGPPPPKPPDTTPPSVPNLSGTAGSKQVILTWTRSSDTDTAGYKVYMDGQLLGVYSSTSANIPDLKNGQKHTFQVTAYDTTGNESGKSNTVTLTPNDMLNVNLIPNADSIIVQISGGAGPYVINWGAAQKTVDQSQYVISGLKLDTEYTVTITDAGGLEYTKKVNTGTQKGYVPPVLPNPQEMFEHMLDVFGTAGVIAISVIGAAVALGVIVVLALWGWRLLKRWLAKAA